MSPIWGHIAGVFIVLMMTTFLGIWVWAWRRRHRPVFDRLARLPMEDECNEDAVPAPAREQHR